MQWPSLNMMTSSKSLVTLTITLAFFEKTYAVPESFRIYDGELFLHPSLSPQPPTGLFNLRKTQAG